MFNRARENYQKQISNINKKYIKKSSKIKINQKHISNINLKNKDDNKINIIPNKNNNKNNDNNPNPTKFSKNIILPKISKNIIPNNKIIDKKSSSIISKIPDKKSNNINQSKKRSMTGNKIRKPPVVELKPFQRNKKMMTVKKRYLKDNNIYTIVTFLDIKTLYNFMLCCKQFYKIANECDDVWYNYYIIKFCKPPKEKIYYEINRGNWKQLYLSASKEIYMKNYDELKNKYLKKYKKNIYSAKKVLKKLN